MEYTLIRLDEKSRKLIADIAPDHAEKVLLDPLDKGLSGATVWLAKWAISGAIETAFSVIKINTKKKIQREVSAFENIVRHLDNDVGTFRWSIDEDANDDELAILVQPFRGDSKSLDIHNLKDKVISIGTISEASQTVDDIFLKRMVNWHPVSREGRHREQMKVRDALDWWMTRYDLIANIEAISIQGISTELQDRFGFDTLELDTIVRGLVETELQMEIGPIHGDLHAQNIIIDRNTGDTHIIDFGWTSHKWKAVDFLMLECSLKFLVAPFTAKCTQLLRLEELLENFDDPTIFNEMDSFVFGPRIKVICAMIARIRQLCVNEFGYVEDFEHYRLGLIALTAGLTSYPSLNQRFLINSLAYHSKRAQQ